MDVSKYEFECQKALHQGLQYARSLGHPLLEVEHIALAMLRSDTMALGKGISERLRKHLEHHLSRFPRVYGTNKVEFGKRLDAAMDAAELKSGRSRVDEDTLWDNLVEQSTVIKTFKARLDVDQSEEINPHSKKVKVDDEIDVEFEELDVDKEKDQKEGKKGKKGRSGGNKVLAKYTIDLTASARQGELDPVIGRDSEVRRVLEILGRKKKNNPILIGEPGVGKTAVAEAIAIRIAEENVPESMKGKSILSLDLGSMLAGAKYRGEFEDRMKKLLKAVQDEQDSIVLFIDEVHMLVGAGNHEGGTDAANLLKPALAKGELHCLGATTLDEYRKYIEKDSALERRFQPLFVEEPNKSVSLAILRGIKSRYEIHHGVQIDDDALSAAVDLSTRYITARFLPDKAIDLMDEAASRLRLQIDSVPAILDELRAEIDQIEIERKAIGKESGHEATLTSLVVKLGKAKEEYSRIEGIWREHQKLLDRMKTEESKRQELRGMFENAKTQANFDLAAKLQYDELPKLESELANIKAVLGNLQKDHPFLRQVVGSVEVAEVISIWTRIPISKLLEDDSKKLLGMEDRLKSRVYGQNEALSLITRAVKRSRVGVNDPNRPLGVFMFLGPTGVGKTETAKALAEEMFGDDTRMVRIDMSEYMEKHNVARLIGSPPGYVGYGEGGELTEAVRRTPYSVVLFDEVEKAHSRVLDILLQICEDGHLTDAQGKFVDFKNTLLIMTSNLKLNLSKKGVESTEQEVRTALAKKLRPEFVNRIDEVVLYRKLGSRHLEKLLERLLTELNGRLNSRQFRVQAGARLRTKMIAQCASGEFGGRALRRTFQTMVTDEVSERILTHAQLSTGVWVVDIDEDGSYIWREDYESHKYLPPAQGS